MIITFELDRFKKLISELVIDLKFNLFEEEFSDTYYSHYPETLIDFEPTVDENGTFIPGHSESKTVWVLTVNGREEFSFTKTYLSLENALLEELNHNLKVAENQNEVVSIYTEFLSILKSKSERLIYNSDSGSIDFSEVPFGDHYNRYKWKYIFDNRIKVFLENNKVLFSYTYSSVLNKLPIERFAPKLIWKKSDIDLLELIVALIESNSIVNSQGSLTRKEAVEQFSTIFNISIKDYESKLSRGTERKKDVSPFLSSLKQAFDDYANSKP